MTKTFKFQNGDVVYHRSTGRVDFVEGRDKARQAIARMLGLAAPDGAGLDDIIGTVPDDEFALAARVQRNVRRAFETLTRKQRSNQLAQRTAEERLASIQRMYVTPANFGGGTSKTGYALRLDVTTVAGEPIKIGAALVGAQGG